MNKINKYISTLKHLNFEYWETKNPFYSEVALNKSAKGIITLLHNKGYLQNFKPNSNSDFIIAIDKEISNFNIKDTNFNSLALTFDLIQAWGGQSGRMPYNLKSGRENFDIWKNIYLEGVINAVKDNVLIALKNWTFIDGLGPSFAPKHLYFWSKKKYPILDTRISLIQTGDTKLLGNIKKYNDFIFLIRILADKCNKTLTETEKALFAFSKNFFPNSNLNLNKTIEDFTDFEIAKEISNLYLEKI